jgi:uncharacterized repeat protein (TIGR02543 family)
MKVIIYKRFVLFFFLLFTLALFESRIDDVTASTSPPSISIFNDSGVAFSSISINGTNYLVLDSIEKLYMIRYDMSANYLLTRDLNFEDIESYLLPDLVGSFNGNGTGTFFSQMSSGSGFLPIGSNLDGSLSSNGNFTGSFLGSGLRTISNLTINRVNTSTTTQEIGLFTMIGNGSKFDQLIFDNFNTIVSVSGTGGVNIGFLAGRVSFLNGNPSNIDISRIFVTGHLDLNADTLPVSRVGGLIGSADEQSNIFININETIVNADISVTSQTFTSAPSHSVGGFIAHLIPSGLIERSAFIGTITSSVPTGGLVGDANGISGPSRLLKIKDSYTNSTIQSNNISNSIGGIVGRIGAGTRGLLLENSYATGDILQNHNLSKRDAAAFIGNQSVSQEYTRQFINSFAVMNNSSTQHKAFGHNAIRMISPPNGYYSIRPEDTINVYVVEELPQSGVLLDEARLVEIVATTDIVFSTNFQESVVGSGSTAWSFEDGRLPLLYFSGTQELMPFQLFRVLQNGSMQTVTGVDVTFVTSTTPATLIQTIYQNSLVTAPQVSREGFAFVGWYTDEELSTLFDFSTPVSSDLTLYAKWELTTFTITFDSGPGSTVNPVSGNEGDVVGLPTPTLQDHRFDGWLNSAGQLVSNPYTMTNVNETFTAKWTFVTFSPITRRPLERELFLLVEGGGVFEYGDPIPFPSVTALERFGSIESDLSGNVIIDGEIGEEIGRYELSFTLSYNGETVVETLIYEIVDTVPPVLTVSFPERIFLNQSVEPVITVSDNAPGDVTVRVVKDLDVSRIGTQLFIIEAVDASGNTTQLIEEVQVLFPEVRQRSVQVNAQRFLFVIQEHLMDFASMVLYMAQSVIEPAINSPQWEVFEEREFVAQGPGERVYLMMMDALGNVISRESIELFWAREPQVMRDQIVYPDIQTSSIIPWGWIGGLTLGSLTIASVGWFVWKRKSNDSSQ